MTQCPYTIGHEDQTVAQLTAARRDFLLLERKLAEALRRVEEAESMRDIARSRDRENVHNRAAELQKLNRSIADKSRAIGSLKRELAEERAELRKAGIPPDPREDVEAPPLHDFQKGFEGTGSPPTLAGSK